MTRIKTSLEDMSGDLESIARNLDRIASSLEQMVNVVTAPGRLVRQIWYGKY